MSKANKTGVNRRNFLRLAGMATIAGAGMLSGCSAKGAANSFPGGEIKFTKETDVVIIGAGGAGLWGAYAIGKAGLKSILVEKMPSWGGDTILACGVLPVHGTKVQIQQGIKDTSPEETWEAAKARYAKNRVPELSRIVTLYAPRCIDIWSEEFKVEFTDMDKNGYTKFFHIPKPGMRNDHKLLEPLFEFAKKSGTEFMFETRAISFIVNDKNETVGVRVQDEVSKKCLDIKAKKVLIASGDWVSNQEMISRYLPVWANTPMTTSTSMGEGIQMALAVGANLSQMDSVANLMSHFAPSVVFGIYDPLIHVSPEGKRMCNENSIFDAPGKAYAAGHTFWWSIFDETLVKGVHAATYQAREKMGGVVKADTIEELAAKTFLPLDALKATIERWNTDAKAGKDTEFGRTIAFAPLKAPFYAFKNTVVRYKTNGGLSINDKAQVVDKNDKPLANLYAAGACQGETTPNVHDVCAIGLYAGEQIVASLKK